MSEMFIESPEVKRLVHDYDILFTTGMMLPVTIDKAAGDTIDICSDSITIHLTSKPSTNDPSKTLPAEDLTIFTRYLASIQHRERSVLELNDGQKKEWAKLLTDMNNPTVN